MGLLAALDQLLRIYAIWCVLVIWCVLKEKGPGTRTVLWIIAILIFPVVGMLAYFLFGRRKSVV